ncbi:putative UDP-GalNAc:polypeptide N-acetylgalactosaminyl transferase [Ixodes scapularis]
MDEDKEVFYKEKPVMQTIDAGDVSERRALRGRLDCHYFKCLVVLDESITPVAPLSRDFSPKSLTSNDRHPKLERAPSPAVFLVRPGHEPGISGKTAAICGPDGARPRPGVSRLPL